MSLVAHSLKKIFPNIKAALINIERHVINIISLADFINAF